MINREQLVYLVLVSEQAERFDDMYSYLKQLILLKVELLDQEIYQLSLALQIQLHTKKSTYCRISFLEDKQVGQDLVYLQKFKKQLQQEIKEYCNEIIQLINTYLLPISTLHKNTLYYYKLRADYFKELGLVLIDDEQQQAYDAADQSYKEGMSFAKQHLKPYDHGVLQIGLNYSIFYYENMNKTNQAILIAQNVVNEVTQKIQELEGQQLKDVNNIIQLFKDNIQLWIE